MTYDLFLATLLFAFVGVITPGPNNVMLMTSGANFGFWRSLPHMTGVAYGFPVMIFLVGLGAMQVFDLWPASYTVLKVLSGAYLLFLAWKIANAAPPDGKMRENARPLTLLQAAMFQWVNPKAWTLALTAITLYAAGRDTASVLWVSGIFALCGTVSATTWVSIGQQLARLLSNPRRLRACNITMAVVLVATMVPAFLP